MLMMPIAGRLTGDENRSATAGRDRLSGHGHHAAPDDDHLSGIDFRTIVMLRMIQVIFMPLIFIPISTLNYIGVPREKNNQVSGLSNFARKSGRQHRNFAADHVSGAPESDAHSDLRRAHDATAIANFQQMLNGFKAMFLSQGYDAATAAKKALAMAYQTVQRRRAHSALRTASGSCPLIVRLSGSAAVHHAAARDPASNKQEQRTS